MLQQLLIRNIALIEQLELSFGEGLHVLTGETGAGKSIVVDALSLLLGWRAERELIRTGCAKAYAEGVFDLQDCPQAEKWLLTHEHEPEEHCVTLSREISVTGRSVCRIQGVSVPLAALREIAALLMDMHGQHEPQSLLHDRNHLACLDAMGDTAYQEKRLETAKTFAMYHDAHGAYMRLKRESANREEKLAQLRRAEEELSGANLVPGEEESLRQERDRYRSSERIVQALREANAVLYETAGGKSAVEQARAAMRALAGISELDSEYNDLYHRAESLYYDAEDIGLTVHAQLDAFDDDPMRAAQVEERLDQLRKLSRKYGASSEEMIARLETVREELIQFESLETSLNALRKKAQDAYRLYMNAASRLTQARKELAAQFEKQMEAQLDDLNMRGTRFYVDFAADGSQPTADGVDDVRFLIAPNAGEEKKPLAKIASGGELSRVMLALKALSAEHALIPSMVFDEIDTGISGRTAQVVAQKMWDIARYRQVICVTHLQQIAAMATRHYLVHKEEQDGRTVTAVQELAGEERTREVARMLSGVSEYSESGMAHAQHMIDEAWHYRDREKT